MSDKTKDLDWCLEWPSGKKVVDIAYSIGTSEIRDAGGDKKVLALLGKLKVSF